MNHAHSQPRSAALQQETCHACAGARACTLPLPPSTHPADAPRRLCLCPPPRNPTDVMIKPDGVQRGLVGEIISRFERKGFQLKGLKLFQCTK